MNDIQAKQSKARYEFYEKIAFLLEKIDWSEKLLAIAQKDCGFTPGYCHVLFPEGVSQVVKSFEEWLDKKAWDLVNQIPKPTKVRDRIALFLQIRITKVLPKEAMLKHSSFFLVPTNILIGSDCACYTVNMIWLYAGDKSTDFNYYTKRGLLLLVYLSAKAYYFADNSTDDIKTKEFIASLLDNIINIANYKNKIKLIKMADIPILRLFS